MGVLIIHEKELEKYINEISSGNEDALRMFYETYGRMILSLILTTVKSGESAEEVLQDVMMSLVQHDPEKPIMNAKCWFYKVIDNLSKRKAMGDRSMQTEPLEEAEEILSGDDVSEKVEDTSDQIEALKCLDRIEQQCVLMCVFGQMKLPQVAEILGIPYDKVRSKYDYAVRKLRKYYERSGYA